MYHPKLPSSPNYSSHILSLSIITYPSPHELDEPLHHLFTITTTMPSLSCLSQNTRSGSQRRSARRSTKIVTMSMDNTDKTVKESRVFAYRKDGRRFTAGHCIETEIHAMAGSYPCPAGSRRVPAMVHSESEAFNKRIEHDPLPGLPQGYQSVQSTVQRAWYRGDLNTWEARWDYTHDIAYRLPQVVSHLSILSSLN